jgi:hypothetical protein
MFIHGGLTLGFSLRKEAKTRRRMILIFKVYFEKGHKDEKKKE